MIRALHEQICSGTVTAHDLVRDYVARIRAKDGREGLNAYITVAEEEAALAAAARVDDAVRRGETIDLLAGIPYAIKDAICTKDMRTTAASAMLEHYVPPYDATVVTRLRAVGAIPLGKTNMDEFAMGASTEQSFFGRTKNPHAPERVPGGSSGGSAAAVAAALAPWALGSDTGGSIRQPAAFCGCVGLKPTYGRVSRYGLIAMASSLDQIGPLTQTVEDAAIVLTRIAGHDPRDATSAATEGKVFETALTCDPATLRVGVLPDAFYDGTDPAILARITATAQALAKAGARITTITLPHLRAALAAYYIIMPSEVSSNMARYDGVRYGAHVTVPGDIHAQYAAVRAQKFGAEVQRRIMLGTYTLSAGYYDQYYAKALKVRRRIVEDFRAAFADVDVLLMPTAPEVAFRAGAKTDDPLTMYLSDVFTVAVNLAGLPAISLPVGWKETEDGPLPIGAQLIGKWFDEARMLAAAATVERLCHHQKSPAHDRSN